MQIKDIKIKMLNKKCGIQRLRQKQNIKQTTDSTQHISEKRIRSHQVFLNVFTICIKIKQNSDIIIA